ncbi:DNA ligase [Paenibacillus medicaginis]|uniref:DNA ligase n=1 Tax=Paenibacillus medicaginis TaxID=1470560 RepID=A0ABV5BWT9_9BACL
MNIGSVIRGLLGDAKAGEMKKLELQTGQVVRGTVMKVSEHGEEAVLQIQGAQVRAKVETPLQEGQTLLLQVQPPNEDGTAVLKPLPQLPGQPQSGMDIAKVLQSVKLPDTPQNRELIQLMQRSGIPLTAEQTALVREAADYLLPSGAKLETIVQAAGVAFQRGLPITPEAVAGLHQAIFGPPLDELLSSLEKLVEQALREGSGGSVSGEPAADTPAVSGRGNAAGLLNTTNAAAGTGTAGTIAGDAGKAGSAPAAGMANGATAQQVDGTGAGGAAVASEAASAKITKMDTGTGSAQGETRSAASGQNGGAPAAAGRGAVSPPAGGLAAPAEGSDRQKPAGDALRAGSAATEAAPQQHALPKLRALLQELRSLVAQQASPVQSDGPGEGRAPAPAAPREAAAPAQAAPPAVASAAQADATAAPAATHREDPWVGRVLKLLGAEHEQQALRAAAGLASRGELPTGAASAGQGAVAQADAATVKGLLLQLMDSSSVPPALKEAAQQVVQQLTGQQLLLNTDRTAPFAQVHMFIPFVGPDGRETASVQIQSKRGRRGELDSSNCRLWFDLDMKALGLTIVDVQVVNRVVSVKVHNDSEWTEALLDSSRDSITEALNGIGYQLLTLKAEPIPVRSQMENGMSANIVGDYSPQVYKGVDIKV